MTDDPHIGCRFNHAHRWPDCYDEAYKPDIFDRLMALWQQPWTEEAFGEAQMLVARLRAALARSEPAGLRERVIKSLDFRYLNPNTDEYVVPVRRVEEALAATPTASPTAEGLIQRAHVACCWCDDHHEEGE